MSIGMTYEQFWEGDPHMVRHFQKAYAIKRKERNQELWLQGFYVYNAIGAFAEILPAFPPKGAKVHPYLEEPVALTEEENRIREEERKRKKMEQIKKRMLAKAIDINARKAGENGERNNN